MGRTKSTTSLAYRDNGLIAETPRMGVNKLWWIAFEFNVVSDSIAMSKSIGEIRSSCRKPLACQIYCPGRQEHYLPRYESKPIWRATNQDRVRAFVFLWHFQSNLTKYKNQKNVKLAPWVLICVTVANKNDKYKFNHIIWDVLHFLRGFCKNGQNDHHCFSLKEVAFFKTVDGYVI